MVLSYNVRPPSDVCWFINLINYSYLRTINNSYWSYKPSQLSDFSWDWLGLRFAVRCGGGLQPLRGSREKSWRNWLRAMGITIGYWGSDVMGMLWKHIGILSPTEINEYDLYIVIVIIYPQLWTCHNVVIMLLFCCELRGHDRNRPCKNTAQKIVYPLVN